MKRDTLAQIVFVLVTEPIFFILGGAEAGVGYDGRYIGTHEAVPLSVRVTFILCGNFIIALPFIIVLYQRWKDERRAAVAVAA